MRLAENEDLDPVTGAHHALARIADGQRLADRVAVGPGGDPADRRAVGKEDRLAAIGIGIVGDIDLEHGQRLPRRGVADLEIGLLVQEILVELDQPVKPGFLRPVFRRIFTSPGPVALFDAERAERPPANRTAAMRGCRLEENFIERHLVIDSAVKFPAQIAGEADTDGKAVDAAHSDPARAHETPALVRQVGVGQAGQHLARAWPGDVEPGDARRRHLETGAVRKRHHVEETPVIALGHAGADHHVALVAGHGDGEVAGHPATHADQRRQAGFADLARHMIGDQRVEPVASAGTCDLVFAEIRDVDDADGITQHRGLAADRLEPVLAGKAVRILGARRIGEPQRMLPSGVQAEDSAHPALHLIGRARHRRTTGGAFLVREMNLETVHILVAHARLCEGLVGPVAEAGQIPCEHVPFRLALDHPLRRQQAEAARLAEPGNDAVAAEIVAKLGHRPEQRV